MGISPEGGRSWSRRRNLRDRFQFSVFLHLPHPRELGRHVGLDLGHHRLELGLAVQRFEIRFVLEGIPPMGTPALVNRLPKSRQRLLLLAPGPGAADGSHPKDGHAQPNSLSVQGAFQILTIFSTRSSAFIPRQYT